MEKVYGFGTIYQRQSDGLWVGSVDLPRLKGEPRRSKVFSSRSRENVEGKLLAYRDRYPAVSHVGREVNMEAARAKGTHTEREWWAKVRAAGRVCSYCNTETTVYTLEQDHIIPVSRGGSDAIDNIAVSCRDCNADKGTMTADEYASWKLGRR